MKCVIEDTFMCHNYVCVCVMMHSGTRYGYVGVDSTHPLYGVRQSASISSLKVHGGITYTEGGENAIYPIIGNFWWFGFDYHHCGDINDYQTAARYFRDDKLALTEQVAFKALDDTFLNTWIALGNTPCIASLGAVKTECKRLARQLRAIERAQKGKRG